MREVWEYRVCSVLCRSEDLVEGTSTRAWHLQRCMRKSGRYPFVHQERIKSSDIRP